MRLPIRLRLTLVFTLSMAVLLTVTGSFVYLRLGADLLRNTDATLLSQADAVAAGLGQRTGAAFSAPGPAGAGDLRTFAQLLGRGGAVLESSPGLAGRPAVAPAALAGIRRPTYLDAAVRGIEGTARIVVLPQGSGQWVVAGTSLGNRAEVLSALLVLLLIGGPVTLALAAAAGWAVAGAALRPVERMRREAEAISVSDRGRRLPIPASRDEITRLGTTLNAMIGRLEAAFDRERRFVADASHELRTPLAILKAELDLARSRPRTKPELLAAVGSAAEEADRLIELAETLLVYSRPRATGCRCAGSRRSWTRCCGTPARRWPRGPRRRAWRWRWSRGRRPPWWIRCCCARRSRTWWATPSRTRPVAGGSARVPRSTAALSGWPSATPARGSMPPS